VKILQKVLGGYFFDSHCIQYQIKSNLFFSSRKNNTQYKKYTYKNMTFRYWRNGWSCRQADSNTIPDLYRPMKHKNLVHVH